MKTILYIVQKEFRQIFRNKGMLPIIFVLPILQLVILSNAATFEIKNIKFSYVDHDKTSFSRALIEKFDASTYLMLLLNFLQKNKRMPQWRKADLMLF
jgi:ABC-2 type transport system permease protein